MSDNKVGKIRRSQVISTYGPGAIIDFRSPEGAPVSAVSAGLDAWDDRSIRKGIKNEQVIHEPRLERKLGVSGFRLPPIGKERTGKKIQGRYDKRDRVLPSVRFPNWHFCPNCDLLQPTKFWGSDPGSPGLYCTSCTAKAERTKKVFAVPVRFVLACPHGHLDEFPWHRWVSHEENCTKKKPLKLKSRGAGLKGLKVHCTECKAVQSLDGAFSPATLTKLGISCSGNSPWLPTAPVACEAEPRVVQRGASNIYFPAIESALDIPPWGGSFQDSLGHDWHRLENIENEDELKRFIEIYILPDWDGPEITADEMFNKVLHHKKLLEGVDTTDLKKDEYNHLTSGEKTEKEDNDGAYFEIHPEAVPPTLADNISQIVRVERLREVRVLRGFTRLSPPTADLGPEELGRLSASKKQWLPGIEVRGEGIFISLDESRLQKWEKIEAVQTRADEVRLAAERDWQERVGEDHPFPLDISARLFLVHTLSHAFMRRLSLECGYSTSSIRERLYVSREESGMCGMLIYTSAPDADGTLGGLSRQGRPKKVEYTLRNAINDMEWCSSDPLCSQGFSTLSDASNLAACHACVFAPETACEHFNSYLDRAMLVGLPDQPEIGFFHDMLQKDG